MAWPRVSIVDQRRAFVMLGFLEGRTQGRLCQRLGSAGRADTGGLDATGRGRRRSLTARAGRSAAPHRTTAAMERRAGDARRASGWGARKIAWRFERDGLAPPAVSSIHAILQRHGRIGERAQTNHSYTRFDEVGVQPAVADGLQGTGADRARPVVSSADGARRSRALPGGPAVLRRLAHRHGQVLAGEDLSPLRPAGGALSR